MKQYWISFAGVLVFILLFPAGLVKAQTPEVTAFWEMDIPPVEGWKVGDLIPLRLHVISPANVTVDLPVLPEQWGTFEIREQTILPLEKDGDHNISVLSLAVQLWEIGIHETPPTTVTLKSAGVTPWIKDVRSLQLVIASVLPVDGNEEALAKRDLKPQADLPRPPVWPWILAVSFAAPLLYFAGRWLWRKLPHRGAVLPAETVPEETDDRFPEEIAYACLDHIARMDLPGIGALKQHYSLLSGCVRTYLEGLYELPAMDMTTTELRWALRKFTIDAEALGLLWEILDQADMVKFAKLRPDAGSAWGIVNVARHFVDCTRPERVAGTMPGQDVGA